MYTNFKPTDYRWDLALQISSFYLLLFGKYIIYRSKFGLTEVG